MLFAVRVIEAIWQLNSLRIMALKMLKMLSKVWRSGQALLKKSIKEKLEE